MPTSTPVPDRSVPQKTTLYCFDCGHESLIEGDWMIHAHDGCVDYQCPDCGTTITSRRSRETPPDDGERRLRCCPGD